MRDSDVLHMGLGGCGVPFALMELWADPAGRGQSANYSFTDIRMDDWYSLVDVRQPTPVRNIRFTDIAGLTQPSLMPSVLSGDVSGVSLDNVVLAGSTVRAATDVPIQTQDGATQATVINTGPQAHIVAPRGWLHPGEKLTFEAIPEDRAAKLHYTWIFGDGTTTTGRKVNHRFADAEGTLLDGSGLYRVLLHLSNDEGRQTWIGTPTVIRTTQDAALPPNLAAKPGVSYQVQATDAGEHIAPRTGSAPTFTLATMQHPATNYTISLSTNLDVPEDGGYLFTVIANDGSSISIDGKKLGEGPLPFAQVCGLSGNAARPITVAAQLGKGRHQVHIRETHGAGEDNFQVLWQGPGIPLGQIPAERLSQP